MARRRGHRSHRRRGHRIRRSRRGTSSPSGRLSSWFKSAVRRPVGKILAPTLGGLGIAQLVLGADAQGQSAFTDIATAIQTGNYQQTAQIPYHISEQIGNSIPYFAGSIVAHLVGKYAKV
jgi:hypothetical protein